MGNPFSMGKNRHIGKKVSGTGGQVFLYQDRLQPAVELGGTGAIVSRLVSTRRFRIKLLLSPGGRSLP